MGYEPLENTYYFIIRECLARDAVQEAQLVIESMARQNLKLKLRTYEPLFRQLLDKSNVPLLNQVWDHMRQHSILPPSEFFIAILMIWRETGEVRHTQLSSFFSSSILLLRFTFIIYYSSTRKLRIRLCLTWQTTQCLFPWSQPMNWIVVVAV